MVLDQHLVQHFVGGLGEACGGEGQDSFPILAVLDEAAGPFGIGGPRGIGGETDGASVAGDSSVY